MLMDPLPPIQSSDPKDSKEVKKQSSSPSLAKSKTASHISRGAEPKNVIRAYYLLVLLDRERDETKDDHKDKSKKASDKPEGSRLVRYKSNVTREDRGACICIGDAWSA